MIFKKKSRKNRQKHGVGSNAQRDLSFKKFVKLRRNISKLTSIITRPTGEPPAVTSKKTLGQAMFYEMYEILDDFFSDNENF